jgi:hypothetical protein
MADGEVVASEGAREADEVATAEYSTADGAAGPVESRNDPAAAGVWRRDDVELRPDREGRPWRAEVGARAPGLAAGQVLDDDVHGGGVLRDVLLGGLEDDRAQRAAAAGYLRRSGLAGERREEERKR